MSLALVNIWPLPREGGCRCSEIKIADLAKMLVHTGALSVRDYELLVMRGHMFPLLESMTDDNWMEIKEQLLEFMYEEYPDDADEEAEPKEA